MPFRAEERLAIRRSDDFDEDRLAPQWQWNHQPRTDFFSLSERRGWLRLKAFRPLEEDELMKAGNTLTQRTFRQAENEVTIRIDISRMEDGQRAGLCHFSGQHSAIGVAMENGEHRLEYRKNGKVRQGPAVRAKYLWLRSEWGLDGLSRYSYSLDGDRFRPFGEPYQMVWGNYKGDRVGIYCFNDRAEAGCVDVDYFHYR